MIYPLPLLQQLKPWHWLSLASARPFLLDIYYEIRMMTKNTTLMQLQERGLKNICRVAVAFAPQ
jgi:hypothetical protein